MSTQPPPDRARVIPKPDKRSVFSREERGALGWLLSGYLSWAFSTTRPCLKACSITMDNQLQQPCCVTMNIWVPGAGWRKQKGQGLSPGLAQQGLSLPGGSGLFVGLWDVRGSKDKCHQPV